METREAPKSRPQKKAPTRTGRPPREQAGEVETRILDAARALFLERGLAGTSVDEIARVARAGKPTIYARYPTKEALFAAVATRNSSDIRSRFEAFVPQGRTVAAKLESLANNVLDRLLSKDMIDVMRLGIAEAHRFPNMAGIGGFTRDRGIQAITYALGELARNGELSELPAFAPATLPTTAEFFVDLVAGRALMRALAGENLDVLRKELGPNIKRGVAFFLAAVRGA